MAEKELTIEKELKKFNWGAAYFGFIWSAVNRCFKKWFIHSLVVSLIAGVVGFGLLKLIEEFVTEWYVWIVLFGGAFLALFVIFVCFIYVGLKGNRWAWENLQDKNIETFHKTQRTWGIVAIVFLSFNILGALANIGMISLLVNSGDNENGTQNRASISAESCKIVSQVLPVALKNAKEDDSWVSNLAVEFEKDENISYAYGSDYSKRFLTLTFDNKDKVLYEHMDIDIVREKSCSISEGNCYLAAPVADKEKACRFYFDDNGKVVPSKKTKLYINK